MRRNGRPVELTDSYYPLSIATGTALAERRKIKGGAPTLLASLGHHPAEVAEDVTVRITSAAERAALELAADAPVLALLRTTTSQAQEAIEVSMMTMLPGAKLHYEIEVA
jgi:Transcriptional regulators